MLAATLALVVAAGGTAWAATVECWAGAGSDEPRCYGTDEVYGGPAKDHIHARGGDDYVDGGNSADRVYGGRGRDTLDLNDPEENNGRDEKHGGPGGDTIHAHEGPEKIFGGKGDDTIESPYADGPADAIRCGPGTDTVVYKAGIDEVASDCEVKRPTR